MVTDPEDFDSFVTGSASSLVRTAYGLTGDRNLSDDLVQESLVRLYLAWGRVHPSARLAYARKTLVRHHLRSARRRSSSEIPTWITDHEVGEQPQGSNQDPDLAAALRDLPPRQRATVVLRFVVDLSVEEVGQLLGCTTGTVKSQTSKGLATLRQHPRLRSERISQ